MKRIAGLLLLIFAASLSGGCSGSSGPPNIILITVDTLRPDRLGYAGHTRPTSPTIDKLAGEGVVFTNALSVSGWTLPSMATILTGHYPKDHGATDFHWSLDAQLPTLAGILRKNGYQTRGYVSHVMLTPTYGIGEGFTQYDFSVLNGGNPHNIETSKALTDLVLADIRDFEEPYFIWVHYFDPHFAYLPHPAFEHFGKSDIDRYDGEIAHTDYHIARLLRRIGDDNTIIMFTSDHGEEFGEHGGQYHYTLHGEVLRVPLLIKAPGLVPRTITERAEQVDLMPTLLNLAGIEQPPGLPGRDLLAGDLAERSIFFERDRPPPWRQRGVLKGNNKLFVVEMADTTEIPPSSRGTEVPVRNVRPGVYLYDIEADPLETNNLYADANPTALELLGLLADHFRESRAQRENVTLDDDMIKKLKSLGYIH